MNKELWIMLCHKTNFPKLHKSNRHFSKTERSLPEDISQFRTKIIVLKIVFKHE